MTKKEAGLFGREGSDKHMAFLLKQKYHEIRFAKKLRDYESTSIN